MNRKNIAVKYLELSNKVYICSQMSKFNWFGLAKKNIIPTPQQQGIQFFDYNNQTVWTSLTEENTAFYMQNCPQLATIINRKASAFINGKTEVLNSTTDNYVRGKYKEWEALLARPNPLQTDRQWRKQIYTYLQCYGYCPVLIKQPAGFTDFSRVTDMWILPPQYLTITKYSNYIGVKTIQEQIKDIKFTYGGTTTILDKDSIFFFVDESTNFDNLLFPDSKLSTLKYPINNIIKNYEARGTIAEKKGAIGILSPDGSDVGGATIATPEQKEQLQTDYAKYGFSRKQWQLIISTISMKFTPISMNIKDMMLLEMETADVITICNALNYPYDLLGSEKGTTFSNLDGAKKMLYQDSIIPDSLNFCEQLNKALHTKENNVKIQYDYSWIPVLQSDEKTKAETRKVQGDAVIHEYNNNAITWNEMRQGLYLDTVVGMDLYKYQLDNLNNNTNGNNNPTTTS